MKEWIHPAIKPVVYIYISSSAVMEWGIFSFHTMGLLECFQDPHLSAITVFTHAQMNRLNLENKPEFDLNRLNTAR